MGDVADGIKSFKKGMQEDEPSASAAVFSEPQIDRQQLLPGRTVGKMHEEA